MHRFFVVVSINCYLLEPLAIYFSIEVKRVFKENIMFLLFFQNYYRLWFFFSFLNKSIFGGLIPLGKNRFILWLDFFYFFKQTCLWGLIPLEKTVSNNYDLVSCNICKINKNISEVFIVFSLKKCFNLISRKDQSNFDFFVSDLCLELFVNIFIFLLQIKKKKKEKEKKRRR
jgi:hypothetical protein